MPKIITVTANTACDHFIEVDGFAPGDTIAARSSVEFASGKGINVARAIESLHGQVHALGFVGRQSKGAFDAISSARLSTGYTFVAGKTRTNITVFDAATHNATHIRTPGFSVTEADCDRLIEAVDSCTARQDVVVLSGSLSVGAPDTLYPTIIARCRERSAIPFLDSSGEGLAHGLKAKPYLIKPNQNELEEYIGRSLCDEQAIVEAARAILERGVRSVVVSRGEHGVVVINERTALAALVDCSAYGPPISAVGCGDALVGGLAFAQIHGYGLRKTVQLAVSCAAANLLSAEPGRFDIETVRGLERRIVIRPL